MVDVPSGTVSLLFSDVEGSTVLLSRLGAAYAEALDGQRQVLRQAWADHGGIELGTEGDSFYVVFPTAEGAVAAAAQGQGDLAQFGWPGGERVRVRMGIHTGSPTVHDGGYVGMDVHRAARVAGAAHGGQVLVSSATAELVTECLPELVTLKNLGFHQLKDITTAEHLYQLSIDGLPADFPPPKTLGTTSSLPRPATPLVGRDGELSELTAVLSSPDVRLVTLTGPGGSGKTRLAIGVAERLVDRFPDGVYFVSLAAAMTAGVMWTSIAEVLDVPPEGRIPPGFFDHVAHRSALFVLDNLEQITDADAVVTQLLDHASQVVVIATSRRGLATPAEHVHPVPPLELPDGSSLDQVQQAGAVQLFVQHARKVKPSFSLTDANAGDVAAVCRRLDGLPLAIELAAARTRLLSPSAVLARLDTALDITAHGSQVPGRQKTLRDTIAWSYNLLSPTEQAFFRHLGVFAGGADLDAITAVTADVVPEIDPLDLVADLVDASLVTIGEDAQGEPRVGMLETIRAYALTVLAANGELDGARRDHAQHYSDVVAHVTSLFLSGAGEAALQGRRLFEAEHDNVREALTWALQPDDTGPPPPERVQLGLRLTAELEEAWRDGGYIAEARRWLEAAISHAEDRESPEVARCLTALSLMLRSQGEWSLACDVASASVAIWRRFDDPARLSNALMRLGETQLQLGDAQAARTSLEEAVTLVQETGHDMALREALVTLAALEASQGNLDRALELDTIALGAAQRNNDELGILLARHNMACTLRELGRVDDARRQMIEQIPQLLRLAGPEMLIVLTEDCAAVLSDTENFHHTARLMGAADAMRQRNRWPRNVGQQAEIEGALSRARGALGPEAWNLKYQHGTAMTVEDALTEAHAATATGGLPAQDPVEARPEKRTTTT